MALLMLFLFYGFLTLAAGQSSVPILTNQNVDVPPLKLVSLPLTKPEAKGLLSVEVENAKGFGVRVALQPDGASVPAETTGFAPKHTLFWKVGSGKDWRLVIDNAMEGRAVASVKVNVSYTPSFEPGPLRGPEAWRVQALVAMTAVVMFGVIWWGKRL
jgi:hypothetical protein